MRKGKPVEAWLIGALSVSLRSGLTGNVFMLQNPGVIAGMIQKVNPFKSSQPQWADAQCSQQVLLQHWKFGRQQQPAGEAGGSV